MSCKKSGYILCAFIALALCMLLAACNAGVIEGTPPEIATRVHSTEAEISSEAHEAVTEEPSTEKITSQTESSTERISEHPTSEESTTRKKKKPKKEEPTEPSSQDGTQEQSRCTITIECTSLLENMSILAEGKAPYVPSDGYILSDYVCEIEGGETVFDILKKAAEENGIDLYTESTMYGKYIAGINYINEKDAGQTSGWMYKVNGTAPPKACDKYTVNNGDSIVFYYVCAA